MSEHILVVGPGRDFPPRIRRFAPGARTTVICDITYIGRIREPGGNTRVVCLRRDAPEQEWIDLAMSVHKFDPFTRVASFGESDQVPYAAIAQALGMTAHSPETVKLAHDKAAMRAWLREKGVDTTASARVGDLDELRAFVRRHGLPCIVKPVSSAGSAGVSRVTSESTLERAWERALGGGHDPADTGVLVEEFLDGPQFSVEAFSESGEHEVVGVTRKYSDPVSFVELGHVSPAPLPDAERRNIETYVKRILEAIGVRDGPTHTEVVLTGRGPRLIETHVRMGGDRIPDLTLDATGVDIDDCAVRQALGERVLPGIRAALGAADRPTHASSIWFGSVDTAGVLEAVTGTDEAAAVPGVTEVSVLAKPGATIAGLVDSDSRLAAVRARADTADAALKAAQEAVSHLEFRLRARPWGGEVV
ncbi:ATP-grasp domain-containing protein [Streptomyces sp. R302]|uniref:ATP-grasp domain-containing protein n=1 Tax=unclassified Streptomyces TaxID=2593676 RepID=UPI00145F16C7|nr:MULTISPECIES: ATP-grasp domain-containing protein [unclassified Streptomyces]NML51331.1 ATP-grasp domain-containing protein [Streptomyces sp. R301]NML79909.1 ATP-grasp domain-containing protein [Streptomyces sp. R302]